MMKALGRTNYGTYSTNKGVDSAFLRICVAIYLMLTFFEFAFSTTMGSLLKFFGLAIMGLWLVYVLCVKVKVKISMATWWLILWLLGNLVSLLWSKDFTTGFYYVYSTANMILFLVVVQNISWNQRSISRLLGLYSVAAATLALLIIVQGDLYHDTGIRYTLKMFGQEMDPNGLSAFLAPVAIMLIHSFIKRQANRIFVLIAFCLCVVAMVMVASRGGMLALLLGVLVYLALYLVWEENIAFFKWIKVGSLIILGGIAFYFIINYVDESLMERLFDFEQYARDGGSDRLELWGLAIQYLKDSPVFGLGIASYYAMTQRGIHNMYLSVLCDAGLFSFIPFMGAIICLLKRMYSRKEKLGMALMTCMMTYILFLDTYQKKTMWNVFIIATLLATYKDTLQNDKKRIRIKKHRKYVFKVRK